MADIIGYVNLSQVVDSLLNERRISSKEWDRFLQVALEGFSRELNIYHLNSFKGSWIEFNSALGSIAWPSDYVSFIAVGHNIGGEFWSYTLDENIIIPQGTVNGQDSLNTGRGENQAVERYDVSSYTTPGGLNSDYYKIDEQNRRIIINGESSKTHLLLYYVSSGVNASEDTVVPIYAERALKDYIMWRTTTDASRVTKKQEWLDSANDLRDHEGHFSEHQFLDMIYRTKHQGIKR